MHHPFCTQICPDMGSAYFIVNVLVVSCCSWLSKAPQNHSMCVLSRCRDSSFINTFGSFNQWHSLRRPYALMEFWASATVRCAGWHRDCTPTYTASFAIFQDAQAVFCSSRGRSVRCAGVFFPPRKVGGFGGRGQWGLAGFGLALSVSCVWELRDTMANWRPGEGEERVLQFQTVLEAVHYRCLLRLKIFWNHPRSTTVMSTSTYLLREPINEEIEMFRE